MKRIIMMALILFISTEATAGRGWFEGDIPPGQQDDDASGNSEHDHKEDETPISDWIPWMALAGAAYGWQVYNKRKGTYV